MKKEQFFRNEIKKFYELKGRNFFWRDEKLTPYQIMLTEILLKKTKASTVDKYISRFLKKFPNNKALLNCKKKTLFKMIKCFGLGKQRTMALKRIATCINGKYDGKLPNRIIKIKEIPYVGLYTRNAIMCFGYNKRFPILDVNVSRVISRFFSISSNMDLRNNTGLQKKAQTLLPRENVKGYNWGLLDLGAMFCRKKPSCFKCPLKKRCDYYFDNNSKTISKKRFNKNMWLLNG